MEESPWLKELKDHLENTPQEELDKEWEELKEYNIGPTVEEYIQMVEQNNMRAALCDKWNRWFDENHYVDGFNEQMTQMSRYKFMSIVCEIFDDIMRGIDAQKQFDNER